MLLWLAKESPMILATLALLIFASGASNANQANTTSNPVVGAARVEYDRVKDYLLKSAEQMPESDYAIKPTATVRSFGEIIGHLASTQFIFCAAAQNQKNPQIADIEKTHTAKTALVDALRASFAYCDSAYAMTDAQALGAIALPNWDQQSPLSVLILNIAHDNEHYGNIVTYLRLRGLVPPSSQPARK
jgi:uncharacterized damage-inducible protein DinB